MPRAVWRHAGQSSHQGCTEDTCCVCRGGKANPMGRQTGQVQAARIACRESHQGTLGFPVWAQGLEAHETSTVPAWGRQGRNIASRRAWRGTHRHRGADVRLRAVAWRYGESARERLDMMPLLSAKLRLCCPQVTLLPVTEGHGSLGKARTLQTT